MENLLEVRGLTTSFTTQKGPLTVVDGVSFTVARGEILGLVGESGCGKSVTSQSLLRLYDEKDSVAYGGEVFFEGEDIMKFSENQMQMKVRGNGIAMVFQDALSSLNPLYTVGSQIAEAILQHKKVSRTKALHCARELLGHTGIPAPEERIYSYPHEMSGGMRQRAMLAMALACSPRLLIADEPTTALDVTIQAQILKLIVDLNRELDMSVMLVTHDLGIVSQTCTRLLIMYLGQIVEEGPVQNIFEQPLHPYPAGLLTSSPTRNPPRGNPLAMIRGVVPAPGETPSGCRFRGRCPQEKTRCAQEEPQLEAKSPSRKVRCFFADEKKEAQRE
jgi:oligopeptide/dipeptide ABC transporter ATP-binding protein